jgi:hypothetical protein
VLSEKVILDQSVASKVPSNRAVSGGFKFTPFGFVGGYQRLGAAYSVHIGVETASALKVQCVLPKHWYVPTSLHGVTTQNNIDILAAVRNARSPLVMTQVSQ